ncbi:MAG: ABC-type multidrug transport system, ATPase component CcmA [Candidatus Methanohalarchaeum thermophilum]|uniref:ABC-type multidrug transport system, ATPase component CcmA n=1 Tax=Methanohalarchaeum thermophilum TaxID=1903181 RepID=A0A1Q6DU89_METT1|nr:MAG: ABC-type multidrug transport system, ATPase component CcmA [Candidatus Methanohalarchaeum thermophilum]
MIEVQNLLKKFGSLRAVDEISFNVKKGEIFGLLGPNGAGKTTTVGMLTSEVKPSSGKATVNDINVKENPIKVKKEIGVIPQHRSLDRKLSGRENIRVMANAYGVNNKHKRINNVLELVGLEDRADDNIRHYSGGMLQRLLIARALVHDPTIIFLDEPTMGLDPQARRAIWDKVTDLNEHDKTISLTTHYMEEADALCDRVAIMNEGEIVERGSPKELKKSDAAENVIKLELDGVNDKVLKEISEITGVTKTEVKDEKDLIKLLVYSENGDEVSPRILSSVNSSDLKINSLDIREPTLEDVFVNLTGERLKNG